MLELGLFEALVLSTCKYLTTLIWAVPFSIRNSSVFLSFCEFTCLNLGQGYIYIIYVYHLIEIKTGLSKLKKKKTSCINNIILDITAYRVFQWIQKSIFQCCQCNNKLGSSQWTYKNVAWIWCLVSLFWH